MKPPVKYPSINGYLPSFTPLMGCGRLTLILLAAMALLHESQLLRPEEALDATASLRGSQCGRERQNNIAIEHTMLNDGSLSMKTPNSTKLYHDTSCSDAPMLACCLQGLRPAGRRLQATRSKTRSKAPSRSRSRPPSITSSPSKYYTATPSSTRSVSKQPSLTRTPSKVPSVSRTTSVSQAPSISPKETLSSTPSSSFVTSPGASDSAQSADSGNTSSSSLTSRVGVGGVIGIGIAITIVMFACVACTVFMYSKWRARGLEIRSAADTSKSTAVVPGSLTEKAPSRPAREQGTRLKKQYSNLLRMIRVTGPRKAPTHHVDVVFLKLQRQQQRLQPQAERRRNKSGKHEPPACRAQDDASTITTNEVLPHQLSSSGISFPNHSIVRRPAVAAFDEMHMPAGTLKRPRSHPSGRQHHRHKHGTRSTVTQQTNDESPAQVFDGTYNSSAATSRLVAAQRARFERMWLDDPESHSTSKPQSSTVPTEPHIFSTPYPATEHDLAVPLQQLRAELQQLSVDVDTQRRSLQVKASRSQRRGMQYI